MDLVHEMGCQFHLVSSTEFNFAVTNDNFTKMKELKKSTIDIQGKIKIYLEPVIRMSRVDITSIFHNSIWFPYLVWADTSRIS